MMSSMLSGTSPLMQTIHVLGDYPTQWSPILQVRQGQMPGVGFGTFHGMPTQMVTGPIAAPKRGVGDELVEGGWAPR